MGCRERFEPIGILVRSQQGRIIVERHVEATRIVELGNQNDVGARRRGGVERRLGEGVPVSALAREFNTSRQTIMRLRDAMPVPG